MRTRQRGFTLPELLAILTVLVTTSMVILPLFADYAVDANTTGCRSNMRRISMAFHTYAREQANGFFPMKAGSGPIPSQWPFSSIITLMAADGYLDDTSLWVCPSDAWDGPNDDIAVQPAVSYGEFQSMGNISYVYMAGHHLASPENPQTAFLLADESNQIENGAATPGNMPALDADDNHGADYRNVLYLDGHISVVTEEAVNAIYDGFVNPAALQAVD